MDLLKKKKKDPTAGTSLTLTPREDSADINRKFICISVKEARHLMAADVNPASSDPYVVITAGKEKFETRVVPRNRFPMWDQRFIIPMDKLTAETQVRFAIYDKDLLAKADFLGEVVLELSIIQELCKYNPDHAENGVWQNVRYKKGTKGALCLGFKELDMKGAEKVQRSLRDLTLDNLISQYEGRNLQVVLQSLSGFRSSGLATTRFAHGGALFLRVRLHSYKQDIKLSIADEIGYRDYNFGDHKVKIPIIFKGFNSDWGRGVVVKDRFEKMDLKLYLVHKDMLGSTVISKAQVPLWSVPDMDVPMPDSARSNTSNTADMLTSPRVVEPDTPTQGAEEPDDEPPAEDLGREFVRIMEPYLPALTDDLGFTFSCALLPKSLGVNVQSEQSKSSNDLNLSRQDTNDEEGEEMDGAEPVPAPVPLEHSIVDCELSLGVNSLFNLLLSGYSEFLRDIHQAEELTNISVGEYETVPGVVQQRTVKYTKPLSVPMAPPKCDVTEEQKIIVKEKGGFICEVIIRTTAPLADNFHVKQQLWGVMHGAGSCKFRVTMEVVFEKEPLKIKALKGTIIRSAAEDSRRFCGALVGRLRTYIAAQTTTQPLTPGGGAAVGAALPTLASVMPPMSLVAGQVVEVPGPLGAFTPYVPLVTAGVCVLCLLLVFVLLGEVKALKRQVAALAGGGMCSNK